MCYSDCPEPLNRAVSPGATAHSRTWSPGTHHQRYRSRILSADAQAGRRSTSPVSPRPTFRQSLRPLTPTRVLRRSTYIVASVYDAPPQKSLWHKGRGIHQEIFAAKWAGRVVRVSTSNAFKRVTLVDERGSLKFGMLGDLFVE